MTGKNPHQYNIPGNEFTKAELEAILNDGLKEAGVDVEMSPQEEIINFGERLNEARQSELRQSDLGLAA